jgi:hydroxymethylbilane synthase
MSPAPLRVGTRGSALALTQSALVAEDVARGLPGEAGYELVRVRTHGDADRTSPLAAIGGTGVFVTAVREALLAGDVDVVVHSMKDLPTAPPADISLACVPVREDPRDALCARDGLTLQTLPHGARVGTGSPRRAAQLLRHRPDLEVVAIRGNAETRLARAIGPDADLDAVVLAASGLIRLGTQAAITQLLDVDLVLPAPAQGALAVEVAASAVADPDAPLTRALAAADDPATRAAATAERALLRTLEAGCSAPVGGYATTTDDGTLTLRGLAISEDGSSVFEGSQSGRVDEADAIGERLAARLLEDGAGAVLSS